MNRASCLAVVGAAVLMAFFGTAVACDDHVGKCELEAWRSAYTPMVKLLVIEGSATCNEGSINTRLYDGEKFIGTADGIIQGHAAYAAAHNIQARPTALTIKYSIQPR